MREIKGSLGKGAAARSRSAARRQEPATDPIRPSMMLMGFLNAGKEEEEEGLRFT